MAPTTKRIESKIIEPKVKRRAWKIPAHEISLVSLPAPASEDYVAPEATDEKHRPLKGAVRDVIRPFTGIDLKGKDSLVLWTGRDPSQVALPLIHNKQGPLQSRVHGLIEFRLADTPDGKRINLIGYTDISRRGSGVLMLPRAVNSIAEMYEQLGTARPHEETPHLKTSVSGGSQAKQIIIRPNQSIIVPGMAEETLRDKHLFFEEYVGRDGKKRMGIRDEHKQWYPAWMVFAPKEYKQKERR